MKSILIAASGGLLATLATVPISQDAEAKSTENLQSIHQAVNLYLSDHDDVFPLMSSPPDANPRERWADRLAPYTRYLETFTNPMAPPEMITRSWARFPDKLWGGYGYNYQYLGNSRIDPNKGLPYAAAKSSLPQPSQTVLVSDTQGVRNDAGEVTGGVYVVDPPFPSQRGTANASGFYAEGDRCGSGPMGCRAAPAEWKPARMQMITLDGKLLVTTRARLDDFNGDGTLDNGWFNGHADPARR